MASGQLYVQQYVLHWPVAAVPQLVQARATLSARCVALGGFLTPLSLAVFLCKMGITLGSNRLAVRTQSSAWHMVGPCITIVTGSSREHARRGRLCLDIITSGILLEDTPPSKPGTKYSALRRSHACRKSWGSPLCPALCQTLGTQALSMSYGVSHLPNHPSGGSSP